MIWILRRPRHLSYVCLWEVLLVPCLHGHHTIDEQTVKGPDLAESFFSVVGWSLTTADCPLTSHESGVSLASLLAFSNSIGSPDTVVGVPEWV